MLQCLEFADRFAELLAFFQVGDGAAERFVAGADQFRRDERAADVQHAFEHVSNPHQILPSTRRR